MILQALCGYYDRLRDDPKSGVALPGFAPQKISYALVIDAQGRLMAVQDIRETSGRTPRPAQLIVPEGAIRASNIVANFLWDNTGYVLGIDDRDPERARKTFEAFKKLHHAMGDRLQDPAMRAVLRFLDRWDPAGRPKRFDWDQITGANLVFRYGDDRGFVHERAKICSLWLAHRAASSASGERTCLVTGERAPVARLHPKIKGVKDAQPSGASLVSFNLDAFCSYGKEQSYNAPVGEKAVFAYTTALNHLLRYDSPQKLQIGDATTVFWTDRSSPVEDMFGYVLGARDPAGDIADAARVADYLRAIRAGMRPESIEAGDRAMRFHILGLAPNASRLVVRFWLADTVEALETHIGQHFADAEMVREFDDQLEFPSVRQLLIETAPLRKSERINPNLEAAVLRSVLGGFPYPSFLLATIVERIRADRSIGYYRAALAKAVLRRNYSHEEVGMALNEELTDVAYRLGRLFAVLEKAQDEAVPGANATIKDRFYGSASATPNVVFPQLVRLSQHHMAKLDPGSRIHKEQIVQSILDDVDATRGFPAHLTLEQQGLFALGYYQQRKALFTKKSDKTAE